MFVGTLTITLTRVYIRTRRIYVPSVHVLKLARNSSMASQLGGKLCSNCSNFANRLSEHSELTIRSRKDTKIWYGAEWPALRQCSVELEKNGKMKMSFFSRIFKRL